MAIYDSRRLVVQKNITFTYFSLTILEKDFKVYIFEQEKRCLQIYVNMQRIPYKKTHNIFFFSIVARVFQKHK